MNSYLCLLRGINVSGKKKILLADFRKLLTKNNFREVKTYIQSGNVIFNSSLRNPSEISALIEHLISENYGYDVPCITYNLKEYSGIITNNPFIEECNENDKQPYVCFTKNIISEEQQLKLNQLKYDGECIIAKSNAVYLYSEIPAHKAKISNNLIEKILKSSCTTRNWRTVNKLHELLKTN